MGSAICSVRIAAADADDAGLHADDAVDPIGADDPERENADDSVGHVEHADEANAAAVGVRVLPLLALDSRAMGALCSHGPLELSHVLRAFWSRALKRKTGTAKLRGRPVETVTSVAGQNLFCSRTRFGGKRVAGDPVFCICHI